MAGGVLDQGVAQPRPVRAAEAEALGEPALETILVAIVQQVVDDLGVINLAACEVHLVRRTQARGLHAHDRMEGLGELNFEGFAHAMPEHHCAFCPLWWQIALARVSVRSRARSNSWKGAALGCTAAERALGAMSSLTIRFVDLAWRVAGRKAVFTPTAAVSPVPPAP